VSERRGANKGAAFAWLVAGSFYAFLVYCIRTGEPWVFGAAVVIGALSGLGLFGAGNLYALQQARRRQIEVARHVAEAQRAQGADRGA
jgi:hypothetical protein